MKPKDASATMARAISSNEARREYIKAILEGLASVDLEARVAILQGALETLLQSLPDLPSDEQLLLAATDAYSAPYACPPEKEYQKYCKHDVICAFKAGARWMRERMK